MHCILFDFKPLHDSNPVIRQLENEKSHFTILPNLRMLFQDQLKAVNRWPAVGKLWENPNYVFKRSPLGTRLLNFTCFRRTTRTGVEKCGRPIYDCYT